MMERWAVALIFAAFLRLSPVYAFQRVLVLTDQAKVYERPDLDSSSFSVLNKGVIVPAGSAMLKDQKKNYWYKVQLPNSKFGYVLAPEVKGSDLDSTLHAAGVTELHGQADEGYSPWNIQLRGMGLLGINLSNQAIMGGAEGEVNVCLPLAGHGYLHRMISLGVAIVQLGQETIFAGSGVVRIYFGSRIEPEVRFRFGRSSGNSWLGANIGISYPFTLSYTHYFAGFAEIGSLYPLNGASVPLWASLGIGFHF